MNTVNINDILTKALVGKKVSKQSGVPEDCWKSTIVSVMPCDLNYGSDSGYMIITSSDAFLIDYNQDLVVEE